jgi:hypothetical protein
MANTYLTRTSTTPTSDKIGTYSFWFKIGALNIDKRLAMSFVDGNNYGYLRIHSDNTLQFYAVGGGSVVSSLITNQLFRDTSAWYHVVLAVDTTQATASNRVKIYVNGTQVTSFSTETYFGLNVVNAMFSASGASQCVIGGAENGTVSWNGSMSHVHFIDGTAYDATAFGEYDANGVWTINTSPSVTYGTNGFFILKNGNSVTDQSPNTNNFTVGGGTLTNTEDSPSNVFATFNPLASKVLGTVGYTLENGNTVLNPSSGTNQWTTSTICTPSTGKFYWEMKSTSSAGGDWPDIGLMFTDSISTHMADSANPQHNFSYAAAIEANGTRWAFGTQTLNWFGGFNNNDIITFAVDVGAGKLWWGVNGSWLNSGDPANGTNAGATFTAGTSITAWTEQYNVGDVQANFGNGYFGTTAVASAGTNASGIGIFEYDVPTGYTALSTKGLNL